MARILVTSMPFAGHVGPLVAVAAELVRRGHSVVGYCGAKYRDRFVAAGTEWLPWTRAQDFDDTRLAETFPKVGTPGPAKVRDAVLRVLGDARMRDRARELGTALTAAGGVKKAGDLVDRLLSQS